jgi:uncharacterized protein DUF2442
VVKDVDHGEALQAAGFSTRSTRIAGLREQGRVNPECHSIEWPGGVDLDPDVLYGTFEPEGGIRIERRVVTEPAGYRS